MGFRKVIVPFPKLLRFVSGIYTNIFGFNRISIKGYKNKLFKRNCFIKKTNFNTIGNANCIQLEKMCVLDNCSFFIYGNNNKIILHESVTAINCEFHIEDDNNIIEIGKNTIISGKSHLACIEGTKIAIGEDCLLSSEVVFRTGDSHTITDIEGKRINHSKSIIIDNHVWIGNKTIFTKGAYVAKNSVVATGSVVTKEFDTPNIIIGGVPSKIIKTDINWNINRNK